MVFCFVYIFTLVFTYIRTHIYIYIYLYIYIYICVYILIFIYSYIYTYVFTCIFTYLTTYLLTLTCICLHTCSVCSFVLFLVVWFCTLCPIFPQVPWMAKGGDPVTPEKQTLKNNPYPSFFLFSPPHTQVPTLSLAYMRTTP